MTVTPYAEGPQEDWLSNLRPDLDHPETEDEQRIRLRDLFGEGADRGRTER
jgi:hypothetical protein